MIKFILSRLHVIYTEDCKYLRWTRLGPKGFVVGIWFLIVLTLWRLCWYTGTLLGLLFFWLFVATYGNYREQSYSK